MPLARVFPIAVGALGIISCPAGEIGARAVDVYAPGANIGYGIVFMLLIAGVIVAAVQAENAGASSRSSGEGLVFCIAGLLVLVSCSIVTAV